jgi:uncharacterized membrane protein YeaQ/YmgE (transglycosylase-associated protein family)
VVRKDKQARGVALNVVTGLIVSWVRQGIQHHWHGLTSWESFFLSWFIHTIGVGIFSAFAAATIMGTHTFFLGDEWKDDIERVVFYEVMTVLVGAFAVVLVANAPEPDETMRCCRRGLPNFARCPTLATGRIA